MGAIGEDAISQLRDRAEITDVIHRYGDLLDRCTYEGPGVLDGLHDVLAADATVDYGIGDVQVGAQAWIDAFGAMSPRIGRVHHNYTNFLYAIDGDRADVTYHALARHTWENGDIYTAGAVFEVGLRREPAGWRIASIVLHVRFSDDPAGRLPRMLPQLRTSFVEHEREGR